jgi:hypothetical protein
VRGNVGHRAEVNGLAGPPRQHAWAVAVPISHLPTLPDPIATCCFRSPVDEEVESGRLVRGVFGR